MSQPKPGERFHRLLIFASDEADALGHASVNNQHLLYALSRESKGLASDVLASFGVSPDTLHQALLETAAPHDRLGVVVDISAETRASIESAVAAAQSWGHRVVDTEHVLYGVLSQHSSADELLSTLTSATAVEILERLQERRQAAPDEAIHEEATHAYRLTLDSAWVLSLATDTARRNRAREVSTLHVLSALLGIRNPAQDVLVNDLGLTEGMLSEHLHTGDFAKRGRLRIPLSRDVQKVIGYAIGEAWNRGHQAVTPLHLAMGLACCEQHLALDILADLGISRNPLIDALEKALPPAIG